MKKRIYLSGAMGCFEKDDLAPLTWRKTVKEWFKLYHDDKFKVFDPAEFYNYQNENHYTEKEIMNYELRAVKMADVVLVNLDRLDKFIGTCDEILYAYMSDVPVIAFSEEENPNIHPWKVEQIDRIETGKNALTKAMTYIASYY